MTKTDKTLKRDQLWLGKDGQLRVVKSVVAFTVLYDVRTRTSAFFGNAEIIERTIIDFDFFQKHNCEEMRPASELENFYKVD